jgi:hypothetical protein
MAGSWSSGKDEAIRRLPRVEFHKGHFDLSKIQDGGLMDCRTGLELSVVMIGR